MARLPFAVVVCTCLLTAPAASFQDTDLETVARSAQAVLGPTFRGMVGRGKNLTLGCASCEGLTMVVFSIGRQTDGTEERVRSGQTTMADLERQCQANEPTCRVERTDVGQAVGWLTTYGSSGIAGNTLVLVSRGDLLIVSSMADKLQTSRKNSRRLMLRVIPDIIGRRQCVSVQERFQNGETHDEAQT